MQEMKQNSQQMQQWPQTLEQFTPFLL